MNITDAILLLTRLRDQYGNVEVVTDCEHCGKSTQPTTIAPGPPVVVVK